MTDLLSSKVIIEEEPPRVRGITAAATSVLGAVGIAQRGPLDQAVLCMSFDEYEATFGGFTPQRGPRARRARFLPERRLRSVGCPHRPSHRRHRSDHR